MDQVRTALAWLKRHHFWVLTVLVALIGLFCWYKASGTLTTEFTANKGTITGEFNSLKTLQGQPFHANDAVNEGQTKEIEKQSTHVGEIWKQLYEAQSEKVLKWPEALSKAFRDTVAKLKFGDDIPSNLRDNYLNYIERHFESLPKQVGARVMAASESGAYGEGFSRGRGEYSRDGGDEGGGVVPVQTEDYLCEWIDQGRVREQLNFQTRPSSLRIWVTQEDLWVYHTLLDIIAKTNEAAHADRMSNAAVRTIVALEVGRLAAFGNQASGRIELNIPQTPVGDGEMAADGAAAPADDSRSEGGGEADMSFDREGGEGGVAMTPEQEAAMLLSRRYLDENGKPLVMGGGAAAPVEGDPAAATGGAAPALPTGAFKRLPVRLTLEMDQRWLQHLLAECASQPLQVEVTEIRINPPGIGGEGGFSSYSSRGEGGGGMGTTLALPTGEIQTFKQQPNLVTVVIQGIITIFNEPDQSVLKPTEQLALGQ